MPIVQGKIKFKIKSLKKKKIKKRQNIAKVKKR